MKIVIRTDASIHIGSGHVMRCLVLAQALVLQGHKVSFACRPQAGDLIQFVRNKGFHVDELIQAQTLIEPSNSGDYQAWLQVPWLDDAQSLCKKIGTADLLVVDHYALNQEWQTWVKQQLGCKVFVIDDLVRKHSADMILDQTYSRQISEYTPASKYVLTGCQFALLAPRFSELRELVSCKRLNIRNPKVLISMGGIDSPNASLQVLQCLERLQLKPSVTVLLSMRSPHYEKVKAFCRLRTEWITHIEFTHTMPELMLEHDLSIGAPGSTSWERACLGLPSVVIPLADNQRQICSALEAAGAVLRVELNDINDKLLSAYNHILNNWVGYQQVNLSICDGLGLKRVVQHIEQLFQ